MKLIKKGRLPEEKIWHGHCRTCNSEFECQQSELTAINYSRDGYVGFAKCTECSMGEIIFYPKT